MKRFRVYYHPAHGHEAVKQGFSWPALFFGVFWALFKRLWNIAAILFVVQLILHMLDLQTQHSGSLTMALLILACSLAVWLLPAFKGNIWREKSLLRKGYSLVSELDAPSAREAIMRCDQDYHGHLII